MNRFENRVALVTGGASGIGAASVRRLVTEGAQVMIADLDGEGAEQLASEIGAMADTFQVDVADSSAVDDMVKATVERFGRLDVLFNNAGIVSTGTVDTLSDEHWKRIMDVDLSSVMYGCRAVIPVMRAQGGGAIVNTASISGLFGDWGIPAYNAAKGAVVNLTKAMAADHARDNIRVNAVCPGGVETPLVADVVASRRAQIEYQRLVPQGRMGKPEEIAAAVAFLASDDASYITGHNLVVDGGVTVTTGQPNFTAIAERWWDPLKN